MVQLEYVFVFTPKIGEMIQFDEHIFQMGWNHQLVQDMVILEKEDVLICVVFFQMDETNIEFHISMTCA